MKISEAKEIDYLLIDGHHLAFRNFYKLETLGFKNKAGEKYYTGITYGFIRGLVSINEDLKPKNIIIAWDGGSKYRRDIYPDYKKNRRDKREKEEKLLLAEGKKPRDIFSEMNDCVETVKYLGIPQYRIKGVEADDIIGTLCRKLSKKHNVMIYSPDHDFNQLLEYDNVEIFKPGQNSKIYNKKKFKSEFGFSPKYYVNVLALGGDQGDGYPGVRGISSESAINLVKDYGPKLSTICEAAAKESTMASRQRTAILKDLEDKKMMWICRKLGKILTDLKIDKTEGLIVKHEFNKEELKKKFKEFRFHSLLDLDKFDEICKIYKKENEKGFLS